MSRSIDDARAEVQRAVDRALAVADTARSRTLFEVETELWRLVLAIGAALLRLFLLRQAMRPRAAKYREGGVAYVLDGERTTEIGTRFGKLEFTRPIGRPAHGRGASDLPVDRELGLCSGFSLGVVMAMMRLCAQLAFQPARTTFASFHGWTPSPRAVLRMVDATGDAARPFLEQAPPPDDDGEVLVIQVDGRGAPMISSDEHSRRARSRRRQLRNQRHGRRRRRRERPRQRRTKGKKSKNAKLAIVGVLYTLRRTSSGLDGPINKRVYATFESHEALFIWLRCEADKRGYGTKQSLFIADGSDHIWRLQKLYFPDAESCLDWYHVVEKLWIAGECLHAEGSEELRDWIALQTKRLRRGATAAVIRGLREHYLAIPKTGPGNKGKRERLQRVLRHLVEHEQRMRYHDLRRRDLDIGSGAAEGAVRNLIAVRLDGPGMRWSRDRAERLLHLRCILVNGQWEQFVEHLATPGQALRLSAAPVPCRPHNAKAAA